jgi:hypothetical protein
VLTPYDEFPVHQAPYPFSVVPITDYAYDDGYYFGIFNADQEIFLFQGMRVNPNNDMIGGYAGIMIGGRQYTARFKRPWRPQFDTRIGPFRFHFVEPFEEIRLTMDDNESALRFDLRWLATAPAFEEAHHVATSRGRTTTDQTRYTQSGTAEGWIELEGQRIEVVRDQWWASRDHSWGLYQQRPPMMPPSKFVRPREAPATRRALRFWTVFSSPHVSGFWGLHEGEHGERIELNDVFGTPFEGALHQGLHSDTIRLVSADHHVEFVPGTLRLRQADVTLVDEAGRTWHQRIEDVGTPWWPHTIGYGAGSWKDGGSLASYPGTDEVVMEYDDFNFSVQPFEHTTYDGRTVRGGAPHAEHLARVTTTTPDGTVSIGAGQVELFIDPPYARYGLSSA